MALHPFKVGDTTFTIGINPSTELPEVCERKVVRVSPKQLEIHGPGGKITHRLLHEYGVNGINLRWRPIVFATAEEALEMYAAQRFDEIERGRRRAEEATRLRNNALAQLHALRSRS